MQERYARQGPTRLRDAARRPATVAILALGVTQIIA
jgi:hypothetical protein